LILIFVQDIHLNMIIKNQIDYDILETMMSDNTLKYDLFNGADDDLIC